MSEHKNDRCMRNSKTRSPTDLSTQPYHGKMNETSNATQEAVMHKIKRPYVKRQEGHGGFC